MVMSRRRWSSTNSANSLARHFRSERPQNLGLMLGRYPAEFVRALLVPERSPEKGLVLRLGLTVHQYQCLEIAPALAYLRGSNQTHTEESKEEPVRRDTWHMAYGHQPQIVTADPGDNVFAKLGIFTPRCIGLDP